jgi:GTP-binding protein
VNITSAIFHCSAPDLAACPDESLPEFAFIGRSNVGKSSLLNMLAGKNGLARTSPTPGFTKLINFFTMNKRWRLVDLPGYGYAQVARKDKSQFNRAVNNYLKNRPNLCCVFALVDSGLEPQEMDVEFIEWLTRNSIPFVIVFTKTDKTGSAKVQANMAAFMARIAEWFAQPPVTFTCSSETGHGRKELLGVIGETLAANPVEPESPEPPAPPAGAPQPDEVEPPFSLRVRAGNRAENIPHAKKPPKGERPW